MCFHFTGQGRTEQYLVGSIWKENSRFGVIPESRTADATLEESQGRGEAGDCAHAQREAWTRGPPAGAVFLQLFSRWAFTVQGCHCPTVWRLTEAGPAA